MNRHGVLIRLLPLALLSVLHGAQAGLFDDQEARKQIAATRQQQEALQQRLGDLDTTVRNMHVADLVAQLQQMSADLNTLRGQIEVLQYNIDTTQKRQKDLYVDLDGRLRALETGGNPGQTAGQAAGQTATAAAVDPAQAANETQAYDQAFTLYKTGSYAAAVTAFQGFLKNYSDSKLAPNAQYWIGMGLSAQRDYKNAILTQQKLVAAWPDSNKAPDALFNIASNQLETGDRKAAKKTLDDLVSRYPASPVAEKAKRLSASLK